MRANLKKFVNITFLTGYCVGLANIWGTTLEIVEGINLNLEPST